MGKAFGRRARRHSTVVAALSASFVLLATACSSASSSHQAQQPSTTQGVDADEQASSYKPGAAPSADAGCPPAEPANASGSARVLHPHLVWDATIPTNRFSTPVAADLNGDHTPDVVIGSGVQFHGGGVTALDGRTGHRLWSRTFSDEAYPTPALDDVNGDGTPDVIIGGRAKDLYALDGHDGRVLWTFLGANPGRTKRSLGSTSSATALRDVDGDGVRDLLFTQSGDTGDRDPRPPGLIHIVSGATGRLLQTVVVPDHREIYSVPSVVDTGAGAARRVVLVFGTAGATVPGHLARLTLTSASGRAPFAAHVDWAIPSGSVGITAAPLVVQSRTRGDVFANLFAGFTFRADVGTGKVCWRSPQLPGVMPTTPAVGRFGGMSSPSVVVKAMAGQSQLLWIDGATGKVVAHVSAGQESWASPLTTDLDGDGFDEVIASLVEHVPPGGFETPSDKASTRVVIYSGRDRHVLWSIDLRGWSSATPLLTDLDGNGHLDLLVPHLDRVARIELDGPSGATAVSAYRGPHNDGVVSWPLH